MTLKELTQGYANLLAFEYRGRSNADRQMNLYVKQFVGDFLAQSLTTCFILDTAVGVQLDTLGKYIGVPRNIGTPEDTAYFGLWTYASLLDPAKYQGTWDPTTNTPVVPSASGNDGFWYVASGPGLSTTPISESFKAGDILVSDGTVWAKQTDDNGNGLTSYVNLVANLNGSFYRYQFNDTSNTDLSDAEYRQILKLQVIRNSSDHTLYSIQNALHTVYPGVISLTDNTDMTLTYGVSSAFPVSKTLLGEYLPRPMAVGINIDIVVPPAMGVEMECRTKTGTTTAVGFVGPTGERFRYRTVTGTMIMVKQAVTTNCSGIPPSGRMENIPVFYFQNEYLNGQVGMKSLGGTETGISYTITGATCQWSDGRPDPVPAHYPMLNGAIVSAPYSFFVPYGTVFTVGIAIQAIYGYGIGAFQVQAGTLAYLDNWDIAEEIAEDGTVTVVRNNTLRYECNTETVPIPGHQGQVPPGGTAYIAAGRPDLFYVPWSTGFVQMEPTYATVTSGETWRQTTGLGCVLGSGFGPTSMSAEGSIMEQYSEVWTTEQDIEIAADPLPWVAGCETPVFIETHADGEEFDFTTGQTRFVAGTSSPLTIGTSYRVVVTFVRRVHGTSDSYVAFATQNINFVADVPVYTSDWIEIPNEEGYDTKVGSAVLEVHDTLAYALTSGGDTLSTSIGDRLVLLP